MPSSFRVRTLIQKAWQTTYANPALLVSGLIISLLSIAHDTFLFPFSGILENEPLQDFLRTLPPSFFFLIGTIFIGKTFVSSQIFILSASDFFRKPRLLILRSRLTGALTYTAIETASLFLLTLTAYLLFTPLLHMRPESVPFSFLTNTSLSIFLLVTLCVTVIKRLTFGYVLLSPLRFPSSLHLSIKLFIRYRYFSATTFFSVLLIIILFTILENLVILQYAFIGRYLPDMLPEAFIFTALLFANTFISIFLEVFWLNFFLTVTNKNRKTKEPIRLLRKEFEEVPSVPFQ